MNTNGRNVSAHRHGDGRRLGMNAEINALLLVLSMIGGIRCDTGICSKWPSSRDFYDWKKGNESKKKQSNL